MSLEGGPGGNAKGGAGHGGNARDEEEEDERRAGRPEGQEVHEEREVEVAEREQPGGVHGTDGVPRDRRGQASGWRLG